MATQACRDKAGTTAFQLYLDIGNLQRQQAASIELRECNRKLLLTFCKDESILKEHVSSHALARSMGLAMGMTIYKWDEDNLCGGKIVATGARTQFDPETGAPRYSNLPSYQKITPSGTLRGLSKEDELLFQAIIDRKRVIPRDHPSARDPIDDLINARNLADTIEKDRIDERFRALQQRELDRQRVAAEREVQARLTKDAQERERLAAIEARDRFYTAQDDFGLF